MHSLIAYQNKLWRYMNYELWMSEYGKENRYDYD